MNLFEVAKKKDEPKSAIAPEQPSLLTTATEPACEAVEEVEEEVEEDGEDSGAEDGVQEDAA